ncbi:hypothetical protein C8R43DRAFT_957001 [Mycena crocata]|nr:hypothetical protein C8R43DRAFT_957001 [Mycena crocata]
MELGASDVEWTEVSRGRSFQQFESQVASGKRSRSDWNLGLSSPEGIIKNLSSSSTPQARFERAAADPHEAIYKFAYLGCEDPNHSLPSLVVEGSILLYRLSWSDEVNRLDNANRIPVRIRSVVAGGKDEFRGSNADHHLISEPRFLDVKFPMLIRTFSAKYNVRMRTTRYQALQHRTQARIEQADPHNTNQAITSLCEDADHPPPGLAALLKYGNFNRRFHTIVRIGFPEELEDWQQAGRTALLARRDSRFPKQRLEKKKFTHYNLTAQARIERANLQKVIWQKCYALCEDADHPLPGLVVVRRQPVQEKMQHGKLDQRREKLRKAERILDESSGKAIEPSYPEDHSSPGPLGHGPGSEREN